MSQRVDTDHNPYDTERFQNDAAMASVLRLQKEQIEWTKRQVLADEEKNTLERNRQAQREEELRQNADRLSIEQSQYKKILLILQTVERLSAQTRESIELCKTRACLPNLDTLQDNMQIALELLRTVAFRVVGKQEIDAIFEASRRGVNINTGDKLDVRGNVGNIVEGTQKNL